MLLSSCKIALPQDLFQKLIGDPAQCRFIRSSASKEFYRRFSALFSEHFEEFVDEEPSFSWLDRFTAVVALAAWVAKSGEIDRITWVGPQAARKYSIPTAIPAYDPRVLRDHGSGQLSQGSDHRFPPFEVTVALGDDRRSCGQQTVLVMAA
jgi:hypothetical protein